MIVFLPFHSFTFSLLLGFVKGTPLGAVIGAVVIEFDLDVRFREGARAGQAPFHVFDVETTGDPHGFVVGLDGCGLGVFRVF